MSDSSDPLVNFRKSSWNFSVTSILEDYGWYLLIFAVILIYVYRKIQPHINKVLKEKSDRDYAAKYHKDPDLAAARIAAQHALVQKLQEKYQKDAEEYQRKLEEKETIKREKRLASQNNDKIGHRLGSASSSSEQHSLKPEYNPLMGDNSRSYRPQRKSPCSGGGCGKK